MDSGNISAIISACAGIGGVLLGNSFLTLKEVVIGHRKRKKDAEYLAILVVSHLDRFTTGCLDVAHDNGEIEGRPAGNGGQYWATTTKPPVLQPLDINVDWKSLPRDLMYSVLRIPDMQEKLQHRLADRYDYDDFPDFGDYFLARQSGYAQLGLEVETVAANLRKHTGMTDVPQEPDDWDKKKAFREIIAQVSKARAEIDLRRQARTNSSPEI